MSKTNEPEDHSSIRYQLSEIILEMYLPSENEDVTEEFISHIDLLETLRGIIEIDNDSAYSIMKELNFKTKLIEGSFYWMVKVST